MHALAQRCNVDELCLRIVRSEFLVVLWVKVIEFNMMRPALGCTCLIAKFRVKLYVALGFSPKKYSNRSLMFLLYLPGIVRIQ